MSTSDISQDSDSQNRPISKFFFCVENWSNLSKKNVFEIFDFKIPYFLKLCPIFVGSVHNFGRSDDDKI